MISYSGKVWQEIFWGMDRFSHKVIITSTVLVWQIMDSPNLANFSAAKLFHYMVYPSPKDYMGPIFS